MRPLIHVKNPEGFPVTTLTSSARFSATARPSLFARLSLAAGLWRQRRALARLDAHARRDLGLSVEAIEAELSKPLWPVLF